MILTEDHVRAARRELAMRSFPDFSCMVDIPTVPLNDENEEDGFSVMKLDKLTKHHQLLCEKMEALEAGRIPNLMLLLPPGSAKSTYADVVFVPWFMSRKARRHTILASYASAIAAKQGRRARQLIQSKSFLNLTDRSLDPSKSAADEWMLDNGSEFMAGGILSGLTGNRAALGILDDPIRGREAAESETIREKTWDAYQDDFCSRLIPGAPQIMILCMTGDTSVLMADGIEKPLRDVRPGDVIATYEDGVITQARVAAWRNNGLDSVYEITTTSGITVKANERHPFLVDRDGVLEWVRLRNLRPGDVMVRAVNAATKGANPVPISANDATDTTNLASAHIPLDIMGNGQALCALPKDAESLLAAKGCALAITVSSDGQTGTGQLQLKAGHGRTSNSGTATVSGLMNTTVCATNKADCAPYACVNQSTAHQATGRMGSASTTTTTLGPSVASCVTTAILSSGEAATPTFSGEPLHTLSVTGEAIVSILPCGSEDVFDIQVERTENFIANGLVSHNTRWHMEDPAGKILPENWNGESGWFDGRDGRKWYVICLPAIADRADDPLGRAIGETLWPEWFSLDHWAPFKRNARTWSSLYQQKPSPEEGTYFKSAWFNRYTDKPPHMNVYMTSDHAPKGGTGSDWNVFNIWGIDHNQHIWLLDEFRCQDTFDVAIGIKHDAQGDIALASEGALPLIRKWKPLCWFPEDDNTWKASAGFVKAAMIRTKAFCRVEPLSASGAGDKATKARPFQAKASMGEVHIPSGFMGDEVLDEYKRFPAGKHDDRVDAAAHIGRVLDMAHPAIVPTVQKVDEPRDRFHRKTRAQSQGSAWG